MIFIFCLALLLSVRGIKRASSIVADWWVYTEERLGETAAWVVLFACLFAYITPTVVAAYLAFNEL